MQSIEYLGIFAGTLTTISFLPQALKIWRTRDVKSISLLMYLMLCLGVLSWIIYGVALNSPSIFVSNSIIFILVLSILFLKILIQYRENK